MFVLTIFLLFKKKKIVYSFNFFLPFKFCFLNDDYIKKSIYYIHWTSQLSLLLFCFFFALCLLFDITPNSGNVNALSECVSLHLQFENASVIVYVCSFSLSSCIYHSISLSHRHTLTHPSPTPHLKKNFIYKYPIYINYFFLLLCSIFFSQL